MTLIDFEKAPTDSMKRWFGLSLAGLLGVLAYFLRNASTPLMLGLLIAGVGIVIVYYVVPATQLPIIRIWQRVTYPIAWIMSHILLGTVFFLVVVPMGIVMRLFGYDPLRMKKKRMNKQGTKETSETNWVPRQDQNDVSRYFKQF